MNVDDVYGTLYSPEDGTIDPAGYCTALTRGAKMNGAKVRKQWYLEPIGHVALVAIIGTTILVLCL